MKTKLYTLLSVIILYSIPMPGIGQNADFVKTGNSLPDQITEKATSGMPSMMPPGMGMTSTYSLFSSNGSISNSGMTFITGDIGTNVGQCTGFNALNVKGMIHLMPDMATGMCLGSLQSLYNSLNLLPVNMELPNPALFGHNMILTPQTYHLGAATMLTDTLYLNALGDPNAVFCIQINGALTTAANSRVMLINGAQSKNVFWKIEGAVTMSANSIFRGIIVSNNGAIVMNSGAMLDGAAFTTTGAITTTSSTVVMPYAAVSTAVEVPVSPNQEVELTVAPNPVGTNTTIHLKADSKYLNGSFKIYNIVGVEVLSSILSKQTITLDTSRLHAGIYFYKLTDKNKVIQSGKLISQN
ncbi:MAG: ice-binding family protein [Paludibacter sp.]|nr:ice-binding family protein [Paludibacter sp.]